jgi:FMN reductase
MARIVCILGSVTPPGRMNRAMEGAMHRATGRGHDVELIDLANVTIEYADARSLSERTDDSGLIVERLSGADAVVLASPVYRASMTGALKNLLDLVPIEALMAKPVGIVAMGATQHHYLGVDHHLRDVMAWFGALVAPISVYLTSADFVEGVLNDAQAEALDQLIETLALLSAVLPGQPDLGPAPLARPTMRARSAS